MNPIFPSSFAKNDRAIAYHDLMQYFALLHADTSSSLIPHLSTLFSHFTTDITSSPSTVVPALEAASWIFSSEFINAAVMRHIATTDATYDFLEEVSQLASSYIEHIEKHHSDTAIATPFSTLLFLISEQRMPDLFEPYSLSFFSTITSLLQLTISSSASRIISPTIQIYACRALCSLLRHYNHTLSISLLLLLRSCTVQEVTEIASTLSELPLERCQKLVPDCKAQASDFLTHIREVLQDKSADAVELSTALWCCLIRLLPASDIYFLMKQGSTGANSAGVLLQPFQSIHSRSASHGITCWNTLLSVITTDDEDWLHNTKFVRVLLRYLNTVISSAMTNRKLLSQASEALEILCSASWPRSHLLFDIDFSLNKEPFNLSHLLNKYLLSPTDHHLHCFFAILSSFLSKIHPHHTSLQPLFRLSHNPSLLPLLPTDKAIFPLLLKHITSGLQALHDIDDIVLLQSAVKLWQEIVLVSGYRLVTLSSQHHTLLTLDADGGELMVLTSADDVAISVLGCINASIIEVGFTYAIFLMLQTWSDVWCGRGSQLRCYIIESYLWLLHRTSGFDTPASLPRIEHAYNAPSTHIGVAMLLAIHDAMLLSENDVVLDSDAMVLVAVRRCMHAIVESMALPALLAWLPSIVSVHTSNSDVLVITEVLHCSYAENLMLLLCTFLSAAANELSHMSTALDANINDDTKQKMIDGLRSVVLLPLTLLCSAARGMRVFSNFNEWASLCEVWHALDDSASDEITMVVGTMSICAYRRCNSWKRAVDDISSKLQLAVKLKPIRPDCFARIIVSVTIDWWCAIESYVKAEPDATTSDSCDLLQIQFVTMLFDSIVSMKNHLRKVSVELTSEYSVARRHSNSSNYSILDTPPATLTCGSGLYIILSVLADAVIKLLDAQQVPVREAEGFVTRVLTCWTALKPQDPKEIEPVATCIHSILEMNVSETLQLYVEQFTKDTSIGSDGGNHVEQKSDVLLTTAVPSSVIDTTVSATTPQRRTFIKAAPPATPVNATPLPTVLGKRPLSDEEYVTVSKPQAAPAGTPRQWAVPALHSKLDRSDLASQSQASELHTQSHSDCMVTESYVLQDDPNMSHNNTTIVSSVLHQSTQQLNSIISACSGNSISDESEESVYMFVDKVYELLGIALRMKRKHKYNK